MRRVRTRVRPAEARDAPLVAETILLASRSHVARGAWDLCFPGTEPQRLAHLQAFARSERRSFFHWEVCLVGESDGVPGAALCAVVPQEIGSFDPTPTIVAELTRAGWTAADLAAMDRRLAPFLTCVFDAAPDVLMVENVATLAAFRRRGLIRALLERALQRGRDAGCRCAQLTILIGNQAAQRAYEGAGFAVIAEKRSPAFAAAIPGCPGLALMQCDL